MSDRGGGGALHVSDRGVVVHRHTFLTGGWWGVTRV